MRAPFPWFGGKSKAAPLIWERFGDVGNYVEPFAGSLAVLLGRPHAPRVETINDLDCHVANFWRSLRYAPEAVAEAADAPVNETEIAARHRWLIDQEAFRRRMATEPDYFDAKIAGLWVWGLSAWIGDGWCSKFSRQLPKMSMCGVHALSRRAQLLKIMQDLRDRLRYVRVACGSWRRVLTYCPTTCHGMTAVLLDPPYFEGNMKYSVGDNQVAHEVREWAIANGDNPLLRIALCGYAGDHEMPANWSAVPWKANKGYRKVISGRHDGHREMIWFSPACLVPNGDVSLAA